MQPEIRPYFLNFLHNLTFKSVRQLLRHISKRFRGQIQIRNYAKYKILPAIILSRTAFISAYPLESWFGQSNNLFLVLILRWFYVRTRE